MCKTTKTAAGRSGERPPTKRFKASTPPAEAPMTMILPVSTLAALTAALSSMAGLSCPLVLRSLRIQIDFTDINLQSLKRTQPQ